MTCDTLPMPVGFTAPPGPDSCLLKAGVAWDAVRVPAWLSRAVLPALGVSTGIVLEDGHGLAWTWFVPVGSISATQLGHGIEVLGAACWVLIPPPSRLTRPGPRWVLEPGFGQTALTSPASLRQAVEDVTTHKVACR